MTSSLMGRECLHTFPHVALVYLYMQKARNREYPVFEWAVISIKQRLSLDRQGGMFIPRYLVSY